MILAKRVLICSPSDDAYMAALLCDSQRALEASLHLNELLIQVSDLIEYQVAVILRDDFVRLDLVLKPLQRVMEVPT